MQFILSWRGRIWKMTEQKCGDCALCIKDDGHPYCAVKDLYTNVELDDMCDEKDIKGEYYFAEEKKGADMIGTNNQDGTCNGCADCCKGKD